MLRTMEAVAKAGARTLSIMALGTMTFSTMALNLKGLFVTFSINDT